MGYMERYGSKRDGFGVGAAAFIITVLLVVLATKVDFFWAGIRHQHAVDQAREYVQDTHPAWIQPGVSCMSQDTDDNGYISCTVTGAGGTGEQEEAIECQEYVLFSFNRGCKARPYGILR